MSLNRPSRRQDDPTFDAGAGGVDLRSLLLISAGAAMFLALATYTPDDLRPWVAFATKNPPNDPVANVIGPFGATVAGYAMFLFGGAAFLLPVSLLWLGLARIFMGLRLLRQGFLPARPLVGMVLFVVSGAVFLGLQKFMLANWDEEFNILGPGGGFGFIGRRMAETSIGTAGLLLLSLLAYAAGLILMTGLRPGTLGRSLRTAFAQLGDLFSGRHKENQLTAAADSTAALEQEKRKAERERRRLEKELRKAGITTPEGFQHTLIDPEGTLDLDELDEGAEDEAPQPAKSRGRRTGSVPQAETTEDEESEEEEEIAEAAPEPPIIDGSRRQAPTGDRKPSLAEWRRQQQKPRAEGEAAPVVRPGTQDYSGYQLPPLDILHWDEAAGDVKIDERALRETQKTIIATLGTFGIQVAPGPITRGPTISRYEIYPSDGLRVSRITALEADLARATRAERINILAPIPGKDTVGIEIANNDKVAVPLRELLEDDTFANTKAKLPLALGKDVYGNTIIADLAAMPHLLVAGATGSGKSVCINSIIGSLLFQFTPEQLRFIMVDPKVVEMQTYNDLPHLVVPVVTDPKKVIMALRWVVNEMEHRYRLFASEGVRNFESFNNRRRKAEEAAAAAAAAAGTAPKARSGRRNRPDENTPLLPLFEGRAPQPEAEDDDGNDAVFVASDLDEEADDAALTTHQVAFATSDADSVWDDSELVAEDNAEFEEESDEPTIPDSIPYIVVIIDELADLMQTAPADMEQLIQRIAQKARAAGIHMILATQTPRAEVITGNIKANIPCRIAFQVSSALDSRVILDTKGAEKLVGKGDMLYLPPGTSKLNRAQGAFVTDDEIHDLVEHCKQQASPAYDKEVQRSLGDATGDDGEAEELSAEDEETLERCIEVIVAERKASTSLLQRRLRLGYGRAARMMDLLEQRGLIGPGDGAKPREVLIGPDDEDFDGSR